MNARPLATLLLTAVLLPAQGQGPGEPDAKKKVRTLQVQGRVLSADGKAIAGAHVHIGDPKKATTAEVLAMAVPVTGADGTFQLPWTWDQESSWDTNALLVANKGHAALRLWLQHYGVPDEASKLPMDLGDLVLDKGQRFVGRLRGADGKPIAGALVVADDLVQERMGGMATQACYARSNDAGIFDLPCALPSGLALTVRAEGHFHLRRQPIAAGTPLEFDLQPSGWIEGIVERDGKPVPNAGLNITFELGGSEDAKADANGAFRIPVAHRGRWRIHSYLVDGKQNWNGHSRLGDGAMKGCVVALRAGEVAESDGKLTVQAVTKGTKAQVAVFRAVVAWGEAQAQPWVRHNLRTQAMQARPAANGAIEVDGPDGEGIAGVVYVTAKGHAPLLQKDVAWSKEQPTLTVELEAEASVAGLVRDPATGKPIAGAVVSAVEAGTADWQPEPVPVAAEDLVRTAADGSFRLGELGEGEWLVHVRAEGRPPIEPVPLTLKAQEVRTGLAIDAASGASVAGKLVGEPIGAGWRVSLRPIGLDGGQQAYGMPVFWGRGGGRFFFNDFSQAQAGPAGASQPVAADGSFAFAGVALGHYTLHLQRPTTVRSGASLELPIESFRVRAAGVQRDFDMQGDVVRAVRGRVTFPAAATAPENLVVIAESAGSGESWQHGGAPTGGRTVVARDGAFAVAVAPGKYRLTVYDLQLGIVLAKSKPVTVKDVDVNHDLAVPLVAVTIECKATGATAGLFDRFELRSVLAADKELGNAIDLDDQYDMGTGLAVEPGATTVQMALPHGEHAVFARSFAVRLRVAEEGPDSALGHVELSVPGDGKTTFTLELGPPKTIGVEGSIDAKDDGAKDGKDVKVQEAGR